MDSKSLVALLAVGLLSVPKLAAAGDFSVFCNYKNSNIQQCATVVADLVTDKFVAKFPADQYQIFVNSNVMTFTNGGFSAYATSGVIPKSSAQFPRITFSSTSIDGSEKVYTAVQAAEKELKVYRQAVKSLMDECDLSPKCEVYRAW